MTSDLTPLLTEMLQQMREVLTRDDIRAGLPLTPQGVTDVSPLYATWTTLYKELKRQHQSIAELDFDIQAMQPWGDFPMSQIDQYSRQGLSLQFWNCKSSFFAVQQQLWSSEYGAQLVSEVGGKSYFTTLTPLDARPQLAGVEPCRVKPCPLSTLIMLQTRLQDTYRQTVIQLGDFALSHYLEVEAALGLHDTLPIVSKRKRLARGIKRILGKQ